LKVLVIVGVAAAVVVGGGEIELQHCEGKHKSLCVLCVLVCVVNLKLKKKKN
jgi:hypothetical protein